jgi:hypothetical protein
MLWDHLFDSPFGVIVMASLLARLFVVYFCDVLYKTFEKYFGFKCIHGSRTTCFILVCRVILATTTSSRQRPPAAAPLRTATAGWAAGPGAGLEPFSARAATRMRTSLT